MIDNHVNAIVAAVEADILDRRGLKSELEACDPIVRQEIRDEWAKLIRLHVEKAIAEEREACAQVALDVFAGNTEIPTETAQESKAWRDCADFICDEIRGRVGTI
jgi:hypothetical protein